MRALHFSVTPLAGAPIRIVRALQKHSPVEARHVVLHPDAYGTRTFDTDLVLPRDREVVLELLGETDVVHLHHYFDLSKNPFEIDFRRWMRGKHKVIRQLHSHPMHLSRASGIPVEQIVFPDVPQLVIAQFHERYYPYAHIVPNIVPIDAPAYLPFPDVERSEEVTIFFAPSVDASAWAQSDPPLRWDTKGFPETAAMLTDLTQRIPHAFARIVRNLPHDQCMALRRTCHLSIDEMVTGSYHLCSLESMAQGLPTFAYLDRRMVSILAELTGCNELPWLNYRLEDALPALERLVNEPELRRALGTNSRRWMETHWREEDMVRHYLNAYRLLVSDPDEFRRPRFNPADRCATWNARGQDDGVWISRVARRRT